MAARYLPLLSSLHLEGGGRELGLYLFCLMFRHHHRYICCYYHHFHQGFSPGRKQLHKQNIHMLTKNPKETARTVVEKLILWLGKDGSTLIISLPLLLLLLPLLSLLPR